MSTPSPVIAAMPKVELHVHLEGSLRPELLIELARKNHIAININTPEEARRFYQYSNFTEFGRVLINCCRVLQTPDDFHALALDLGQQLAEQNVLYAEVFWTPQLHKHLGYSHDAIFEALKTAACSIQERYQLTINWIPDVMRSRPEEARDVMLWASQDKIRADGVVALGLAGPEADHSLKPFISIFKEARKRGLPANPHSGEGTSPAHILETLTHLQPKRIGHGVSCVNHRKLMKQLVKDKVHLEVCLSSNLSLKLFDRIEDHPLPKLLAAGCRLSLNTDDPALFQTDLGSEYQLAHDKLGITQEQLIVCNLHAIEATQLALQEQSALKQRYTDLCSNL